MTEAKLREQAISQASKALRKLAELASGDSMPVQDRAKVLQWMVELGVGKARIMDAAGDGAGTQRGGIVILPAVDMPKDFGGFTV